METKTISKTKKRFFNSSNDDKSNNFIDKIFDALDKVDENNWEKYTNYKMPLPANLFSKRNYKGYNILTLSLDTLVNGFSTAYYATFPAIKSAGGKLKKGSKCVFIEALSFKYKNKINNNYITEKEYNNLNENDKKDINIIPIIIYHKVFNSEWIENINDIDLNIDVNDIEEIEFKEQNNCELFISNIINQGNLNLNFKPCETAFYSPKLDYVQLPNKNYFTAEDKFYSTLFHEIIHWTGHVSRLDRDLKGHNEIKSYSFEELIAEMGSMLLCFQFGITSEFINSVRYLKGWSNIHKNDRVEKIKNAFIESKKAKKFLENI